MTAEANRCAGIVIDWTADPDEWMRAQIEAAPPLTDQQRTALAELLKPVRVNRGG